LPMKARKRAAVAQTECVACGSCVSVCPKGVIQIVKGMYAQIEQALCVGCGKCKTALSGHV
jgi:ferredoxin